MKVYCFWTIVGKLKMCSFEEDQELSIEGELTITLNTINECINELSFKQELLKLWDVHERNVHNNKFEYFKKTTEGKDAIQCFLKNVRCAQPLRFLLPLFVGKFQLYDTLGVMSSIARNKHFSRPMKLKILWNLATKDKFAIDHDDLEVLLKANFDEIVLFILERERLVPYSTKSKSNLIDKIIDNASSLYWLERMFNALIRHHNSFLFQNAEETSEHDTFIASTCCSIARRMNDWTNEDTQVNLKSRFIVLASQIYNFVLQSRAVTSYERACLTLVDGNNIQTINFFLSGCTIEWHDIWKNREKSPLLLATTLNYNKVCRAIYKCMSPSCRSVWAKWAIENHKQFSNGLFPRFIWRCIRKHIFGHVQTLHYLCATFLNRDWTKLDALLLKNTLRKFLSRFDCSVYENRCAILKELLHVIELNVESNQSSQHDLILLLWSCADFREEVVDVDPGLFVLLPLPIFKSCVHLFVERLFRRRTPLRFLVGSQKRLWSLLHRRWLSDVRAHTLRRILFRKLVSRVYSLALNMFRGQGALIDATLTWPYIFEMLLNELLIENEK